MANVMLTAMHKIGLDRHRAVRRFNGGVLAAKNGPQRLRDSEIVGFALRFSTALRLLFKATATKGWRCESTVT